jgi:CRP-like cAMP-binding protein
MKESYTIEEVIEFLCGIHPLSPECRACLRSVIKFKEVRRNELILEVGQINEHIYFIRQGIIHCYYYHNEKPVPDWFFGEGEFVVSIGSFYDQLPSEDRMEPLEDCQVFYITKKQYDHLCDTFPEFNFVARVLLEKYLKLFHEYCRLIRGKSTLERYESLLRKIPELLLRVPLRLLATWLGMDPATLSRMRSKLH